MDILETPSLCAWLPWLDLHVHPFVVLLQMQRIEPHNLKLPQVWPIKLPNSKFAMSQARVENFLRVMGSAVAAYVQVGGFSLGIMSEIMPESLTLLTPLYNLFAALLQLFAPIREQK